MKWNSPFYGIEGQGWFLSFDCFTRYVKVTFFRGASLRPVPPGASYDKNTRYLDIHEGDELDEARMANWLKQAGALPGFSGLAPDHSVKRPDAWLTRQGLRRAVSAARSSAAAHGDALGRAHADGARGAGGEIEAHALGVGAAIVDAHPDRLAGVRIGDHEAGAEGQRLVGGGEPIRIEYFP
jgi:hypothetical protein